MAFATLHFPMLLVPTALPARVLLHSVDKHESVLCELLWIALIRLHASDLTCWLFVEVLPFQLSYERGIVSKRLSKLISAPKDQLMLNPVFMAGGDVIASGDKPFRNLDMERPEPEGVADFPQLEQGRKEGKDKAERRLAMGGKYDDIINMPHHVSATHPHMSRLARAAQFSPFAAVAGHKEAVAEAERFTVEKIELDSTVLDEIGARLERLSRCLEQKPCVRLTFFCTDEKKEGGRYVTLSGTVAKIDGQGKAVVMEDGTRIHFSDLAALDGDLFPDMEL